VCPAARACHRGAGAGHPPASLVLVVSSHATALSIRTSHQHYVRAEPPCGWQLVVASLMSAPYCAPASPHTPADIKGACKCSGWRAQVDLDDMEWRPSASSQRSGASEPVMPGSAPGVACPGSGAGCYARGCRCGGQFWLAEAELREDAEGVLVPCCTCSAVIHVLYGLAPG